MPGISSHKFASHLWIQSLPESCKIGRGLHSPVVRREQMYYQRDTVGSNTRSVSHTEEVLKARRNPRWLVSAVMNLGLTPTLQSNGRRSKFPQKLLIYLLL